MDAKEGSFLLENGFKVLHVKFDLNSSATRQLFYKAHRVHHATDDAKPEGRTLFVINVPSYCTESIGELFKTNGVVGKVHFQQQLSASGSTTRAIAERNATAHIADPTSNVVKGFKAAYVVFAKEVHLKKVLKAEFANPLFLSTPEEPLEIGMKKWIRDYNSSMPEVAVMQANIDRFMEEYDKKLQEEEKLAKKEEGVPDDDGWIKVTKLSKKSVISRTTAKEKRINEKELKKKPRKELQNFYTFQIRESKMQHIAQMRQKFEDDKRRISLMKEARKFKPY